MLYFTYFGRMPAPNEVAYHVNSGVPRPQMALNFMNTEEFNIGGLLIAGLHVGILDRDAEYGGWLYQRNALMKAIVDQRQLVSNFLGAAEYELKFGTPSNSEFVRLLYRNVLQREPTDADVQFQADAVRATNRTQVATNFLNSAEFRRVSDLVSRRSFCTPVCCSGTVLPPNALRPLHNWPIQIG